MVLSEKVSRKVCVANIRGSGGKRGKNACFVRIMTASSTIHYGQKQTQVVGGLEAIK
jgi:hypothetical protein